MDYCEIILDSVHKVVTAEVAKELKGLDGILTTAQVLEIKNNTTYTVRDEGGRRLTVTGDKELSLLINDYVYLIGTTILAKKLDNSQVPIAVNESLKDFVSFAEEEWNNISEGLLSFELDTPQQCNRLLFNAVVGAENNNSNYNVSIRVVNEEGRSYGLDFTQLDLIGRIGKLTGFTQRQMYELNLGVITKVIIQTSANSPYSKIGVSLGSNAEGAADRMGLKLYCNAQELEYKTAVNGEINEISFPISQSWIYIDDENNLQSETNLSEKIKYYRYNLNYNTGDEYGGLNWEKIVIENNIINENNLLPNLDSTRIKAVIARGQEIVTSNELEFKNIKLTREGIISNMRLKFNDGRNGHFPFYSPSGTVLNKYSAETIKERQVTFSFVNTEEGRDINTLIKRVVWTVDVDKIELSQKLKNDLSVRVSTVRKDSLGNSIIDVDTTQRKTNDDDKNPNWQNFEFFIKNSINLQNDSEDLITCTVTLEGDEIPYIASIPLSFTTDLTGNSGYSIAIDLQEEASGEICYSADVTKNYKLLISIWDKEGNQIQPKDIIPSWYGAGADSRLFTLTANYNYVFLKANFNSLDNIKTISHILKLIIKIGGEDQNFNPKTSVIEALYPLAISSNSDIYYNGPKEFIYNSAGLALTPLKKEVSFIERSTGNKKPSGQISLQTVALKDQSYFLELIVDSRSTTLNALSYYDSQINNPSEYYYNVCCDDRQGSFFCQPILIYQNTQFSSYLDDWNGELMIDDNKNAILSASLIAGTKNEHNNFTGVIIGDIGSIQDDGEVTSIQSGILGFSDAVQSFGFNTDGTAFIGKSGAGRIHFSGNDGLIVSNKWLNADGTIKDNNADGGIKIDLAKGHLEIKNQNNHLIFNDNGLDIQVNGGKNLLLNSDFATPPTIPSNAIYTFEKDEVIFAADKNSPNIGGTNWSLYAFQLRLGPKAIQSLNQKERKLTISFEYWIEEEIKEKDGTGDPFSGTQLVLAAKKSDGSAITSNLWYSCPEGNNIKPSTETATWTKISRSFSVHSDLDGAIITDARLSFLFRDVIGKLKIRHPQVEFGNFATEWNPSSEDTDAAVNKLIANTQGIGAQSIERSGDGYKFLLDTKGFRISSLSPTEGEKDIMTINEEGGTFRGKIRTDDIEVAKTIKIGRNLTFSADQGVLSEDVTVKNWRLERGGSTSFHFDGWSGTPMLQVGARNNIILSLDFKTKYAKDTMWGISMKIKATLRFIDPDTSIPLEETYTSTTHKTIDQQYTLGQNTYGTQEVQISAQHFYTFENVVGPYINNNYNYAWDVIIQDLVITPPAEGVISDTNYFSLSGSILPTETGFFLGSQTLPWQEVVSNEFLTTTKETISDYEIQSKLLPDRLMFVPTFNSSTLEGLGLICTGNTIELEGSWTGRLTDPSSKMYKKDIENIPISYDTLFNELRPVRYKMRNENSGCFHTGYILEELKEAIIKAGLQTSDFAAYKINNEDTGDGGIYYTELVPLNTWQIQRLKSQFSSLEQKIKQIEDKISN